MSGGLDDLVTESAAKLMAATAADHAAISEQVVADMVSQFGVGSVFTLRLPAFLETKKADFAACIPAENLEVRQ